MGSYNELNPWSHGKEVSDSYNNEPSEVPLVWVQWSTSLVREGHWEPQNYKSVGLWWSRPWETIGKKDSEQYFPCPWVVGNLRSRPLARPFLPVHPSPKKLYLSQLSGYYWHCLSYCKYPVTFFISYKYDSVFKIDPCKKPQTLRLLIPQIRPFTRPFIPDVTQCPEPFPLWPIKSQGTDSKIPISIIFLLKNLFIFLHYWKPITLLALQPPPVVGMFSTSLHTTEPGHGVGSLFAPCCRF